MIEGNFEARKIGMRQNKEGVIISFVVQPDDFEAALAMVPIGARVMIGWAQIGDDEKPIENDGIRAGVVVGKTLPRTSTVPRPQANEAGISKPKKRFEDYPLSAQCAMRCEDEKFWEFLNCGNWNVPYRIRSGADSTNYIRAHLGVDHRSYLDATHPKHSSIAANRWAAIEMEYQGYLTDQRHAESIHR